MIKKIREIFQKKKAEKTRKEYLDLLEKQPSDTRSRLKLGDLYAKSGRRHEAIEQYMISAETFANAGFHLKSIALYKQILKLDHSEVASEVCKTWSIPEPLTVAIKYHHYPSQSDGCKLAYIVHLADAIAMMTGLGLGIDGTFYQMDDKTLENLDLQEEDVNDIMGKVLEAVHKIIE